MPEKRGVWDAAESDGAGVQRDGQRELPERPGAAGILQQHHRPHPAREGARGRHRQAVRGLAGLTLCEGARSDPLQAHRGAAG